MSVTMTKVLASKSSLITPGSIAAAALTLGAQIHTMHVESIQTLNDMKAMAEKSAIKIEASVEKNTDQIREMREEMRRSGRVALIERSQD